MLHHLVPMDGKRCMMNVGLRKWRLSLVFRQSMAMLLVVVMGCASRVPVTRRDADGGETLIMRRHAQDGGPVQLGAPEFKLAIRELAPKVRPSWRPHGAARRLFEMDTRSGWYLYEGRSRRLIPTDENLLAAEMPTAEKALTEDYLRWCERTQRPGDCLGLLLEAPLLAGDGRYALAMAIAQGTVLGEMADALQDIADPVALRSMVLWTMTLFMLLWVVPEPISKGIAATLTVALIGWLGVDTVWNLITGWIRLTAEVDRATTFEQIREVGQEYGKVMGQSAARAFVMLATVALGNVASGLAARLPQLPGFPMAAARISAGGQLRLSAASGVSAVALNAEGFIMVLAPGSVAMAARGTPGTGPVQDHHIATDKNDKSIARGGPWTPRFKKIFDRAGMKQSDVENRVPIESHQGPHPEKYHRIVFKELDEAVSNCRTTAECRSALIKALDRLAKEIATAGKELNQLVTKGTGR